MRDSSNHKRYTEIELPAYRYIPGVGRHPSDRKGEPHIPALPDEETDLSNDSWPGIIRYKYAIDLFNCGYWWEAHEVLEYLWIKAGKQNTTAKFLQGIIQIAAALIKQNTSNLQAAINLAELGLAKMNLSEGTFLGIDINDFTQQTRFHFSENKNSPMFITLDQL